MAEAALPITDGAPLAITDGAPLAIVLVHGEDAFDVPFGAAVEREDRLVVGARPRQWLILGPPGSGAAIVADVEASNGGGFVTAVDLTSARALFDLQGDRAGDLLAKVCALDLARAPDGSSFTTSVAKVTAGIVRRRRDSYLVHCSRSYGPYLHDALRDAGREFGGDARIKTG